MGLSRTRNPRQNIWNIEDQGLGFLLPGFKSLSLISAAQMPAASTTAPPLPFAEVRGLSKRFRPKDLGFIGA